MNEQSLPHSTHQNRLARELCTQFIYQNSITGEYRPIQKLDGYEKALKLIAEQDEFNVSKDQYAFAVNLLRALDANYQVILEEISKLSKTWKISRLAKIDLAILMMAIVEMNYLKLSPDKVIINEAIEIAKLYSSQDSGKFINGILSNFIK
jgi:N utilization substance protein B